MDNLFDDPIDDLLSEGSNDSFFGDPKSKKITKSASQVFDLGEDIKPETKIDTIPTESVFKSNMDSLKTGTKDRVLTLEKGDVTDLLDSQETKKSKASVMNEILGISDKEETKVFTFDDILKSSNLSKKESTKKLESEPQTSILNIQTTKEPRRGRRGSANIDPLGLLDIAPKKSPLHEPALEMKETRDTKIKLTKSAGILDEEKTSELSKIKSVSFLDTKETSLFTGGRRRESIRKSSETELPDWLKGSGTTLSQTDSGISTDIHSVQKTGSNATVNIPIESKSSMSADTVTTKSSTGQLDSSLISSNMIDTLLKQQKLSESSMEIQNSSLILQQQESQLMIALQLKKYEQNLSDMQKMQQDILSKQEQQFNMLIEKQFSKQQIMEENMRLQQERINQHIQLLLSQPVSSNLKQSIEEHHKKEDLLKETFEENRAFYADIINSLKQKHQEEITLLEDSYKKQLSFLEMSLESTETRLKSEIDSLTTYYNNKLAEVVAKNSETIEEYEDKIKKINEQNDKLMQEMKEYYNELVKEIKNEYKHMVEDLNKNKSRDEEVISNAGVFTEKLNTSIELLKNNTVIVNEMQNTVKTEKMLINDIKTESLSVKEQEIKIMQVSLEKQRAASENERAQLLALVKTMETRLMDQTQAAREERWTLQQATATMAARALAMDKEIEFMKNNLEFEREQLKNLKETHLAENEQMKVQLTEEKLAIAAEKSRIETSSKLNQNYDINRGKAEIEAALQVAKEATELTDREREKLCRKQCEFETLKRALLDKERKLLMKEQELENLAKMAEQRYKDGEKAMMDARRIENKCTDRLKDMQRHSSNLANREKKLAEEKIALSKERLSIHNTLAENKCSLCKVGSRNPSIHEDQDELNIVEQDHSDSYRVQDMELLRLKYELDDEAPTSIREND